MPTKEVTIRNMICNQILTNNVTKSCIIDAISSIPREIFVPENFKSVAYVDEEIPLGHNRFLLSPLLFAQALDILDVQPDNAVLDIACGQGYSTAVFSQMARKVVALESSSPLLSLANKAIHSLGIENALMISGDVTLGHIEGAPYDKIFINGSVKKVPTSITEQLNEGGKMVVVKQCDDGPLSEMVVLTKHQDSIHTQHIRYTSLAQLQDFN